MEHPQRRRQLGLFVIGSSLLLSAMAVFFGGTPHLFQKRNSYTIVFKDYAPNVSKGTPVRKSGVRIGEVESVDLDDTTGQVRVRISIEPKYTIRDNEQAVIVPDLLSRDTTIDFMPAQEEKPKTKPAPPQTKADIVPAALHAQNPPPPAKQEPQPPQPNPLGNPIPPGSEIKGVVPPDLKQMLREASEVLPSAQMSLNQIRKSVERFERVAPILENTLEEYTELARSLREVVPEVRRTNDDIRVAVVRTSKTMDEAQDAIRQYKRLGERVDVMLQTNREDIDRIIRNVSDMSQRVVALLSDENQRNFSAGLRNLQSMTKNLDDLSTQLRTQTLPQLDGVLLNVQQLTKPLADRADRIAQNLDAGIANLARTAGVFGDAFSQNGSMQRFLNDPAIYTNLNDASLMLVRILPRVDRVMKDLEVFADKIARHPETIGVGGAVRPSAGLKDPPGGPHH
jgi:ABC-type transporter Mla subunit MlaD